MTSQSSCLISLLWTDHSDVSRHRPTISHWVLLCIHHSGGDAFQRAIVHHQEVDSKAGLDTMHLQGEVCHSNNSLWRHTEARTRKTSEFKLSACHVQNDKQTAPATGLERQCRQVLNCQRKMRFSAVVKMYYSERQHKKQEGKLCTGPKFKPCVKLIRRACFCCHKNRNQHFCWRLAPEWRGENNEKGRTCGTVHRILQVNFNYSKTVYVRADLNSDVLP